MVKSVDSMIADIPRAISDGTIAAAYGLSVATVTRIRRDINGKHSNAQKGRPRGFTDMEPSAYDGDINQHRKNMRIGSAALLDAMNRAFANGARG